MLRIRLTSKIEEERANFISFILDNYFYNYKKYKNVKIDSKKDYVEMTCEVNKDLVEKVSDGYGE